MSFASDTAFRNDFTFPGTKFLLTFFFFVSQKWFFISTFRFFLKFSFLNLLFLFYCSISWNCSIIFFAQLQVEMYSNIAQVKYQTTIWPIIRPQIMVEYQGFLNSKTRSSYSPNFDFNHLSVCQDKNQAFFSLFLVVVNIFKNTPIEPLSLCFMDLIP